MTRQPDDSLETLGFVALVAVPVALALLAGVMLTWWWTE
jgi:hypothetical protein